MKSARLDLFKFVPFRLNRLAAELSSALAVEYEQRYGLDIPSWRVLATLGFRKEACSAQYVAECTRTHKSTISRAVTALMKRQFIERVENENDRREFRLRLTRKGRTLYEELFPRLLQREQEILAGLSAQERTQVGERGERLDESVPGSGLGLAIVRDISKLYGGFFALDASPMGGVLARLELPAIQ